MGVKTPRDPGALWLPVLPTSAPSQLRRAAISRAAFVIDRLFDDAHKVLSNVSLPDDAPKVKRAQELAERLFAEATGHDGELHARMELVLYVKSAAAWLRRGSPLDTPDECYARAHSMFAAAWPEYGSRVQAGDFQEAIDAWLASEPQSKRRGRTPARWKRVADLATKAGLRTKPGTLERQYRQFGNNAAVIW